MTRAFDWLLALLLVAACAWFGPWLDGRQPSDTDAQQAAAADLHDALAAARTAQHMARAEAAMRHASGQLAALEVRP